MRIAVPTNDGTSVSDHFGRSAAFMVLEIDGGEIRSRQMRQNTARHTGPHAACAGHSPAQGGEEWHGHADSSHAGILAALSGCDIVICSGMGRRAADALKAGGVREILFAEAGPIEKAMSDYFSGRLTTAGQHFCRCSH